MKRSCFDWLYPCICPGCGKPSDRKDRQWCWDCFRKIELFTRSLCEKCGQPAEGNIAHAFICSACMKHPPRFDRARAAANFDGSLRDQLHGFKYNQSTWMAQDLVDLLEGALQAHFEPDRIDVVIPVPLHPLRQRERSYNQAALLAEGLAQRIGRRWDMTSLARIRETETQTQFDAAHRRMNIAGAFSVVRPEWIARRSVLLVDDVMTTGATLDECAKVLKQAQARTVWALTVARRKH